MSDTANKSPLQFPLTTIFIFCCIVAIPLALVTQVLHVDAGVRVTLAVTMLVASAYVVAIILKGRCVVLGRGHRRHGEYPYGVLPSC